MNEPRSLRLELAPSPRFALLILVLHALAGLAAAVSLPGMAGSALGAALACLGAAAAWGRALLRAPTSVRAIELHGPTAALLELADGTRIAAEAGERRYASGLLVSLPLRRPVRRTVLVTRDMLPADSFRRLRMWAIWGKLPAVAGKQLAS